MIQREEEFKIRLLYDNKSGHFSAEKLLEYELINI